MKRTLTHIAAGIGLLIAGVLALGIAANFLVSIVAFWVSLPVVVSAAGAAVGGIAVLVGLWALMGRRRP